MLDLPCPRLLILRCPHPRALSYLHKTSKFFFLVYIFVPHLPQEIQFYRQPGKEISTEVTIQAIIRSGSSSPFSFFFPPFFFFFHQTFYYFHQISWDNNRIEVSTWCELRGFLNHPIHTKHLRPSFASNFYEPSPTIITI